MLRSMTWASMGPLDRPSMMAALGARSKPTGTRWARRRSLTVNVGGYASVQPGMAFEPPV